MFNANSTIFQLYHGENKLIFHEMIMSPLCSRPTCLVVFYSANSLKQQSAGRLHSDTFFRFRADQSLLFLFNAACGEATHTNFIVFGLIQPGIEPTGTRIPPFPHLVPPTIMVWIFVWKYIFEPFIHILHFVIQLSRSTNFCF